VNDKRRKELQGIVNRLNNALEDLESLRDEEADAVSGMEGTNLEMTERYDIAARASECLESAVSSLEDVVNAIEEAIE